MPLPTQDFDALLGEDGTPGLSPNVAFKLFHWKDRDGSWDLETEGLDKPTFLPALQPLAMMPGANGISRREDGSKASDMYAASVLRMRQKGAVFIDQGAIEGGVVRRVKCQGGGAYHHLFCDTPVPASGGRVRPDLHDRAAYNQFRLKLVTDGVIKPPLDEVVVAAKDRMARKLAAVEREQNIPDSIRTKVANRHANRAELAEQAVVPKAAPAKRARRS